VLIAFGKCRPPNGVVSLAGLCFTIVAGFRTGYVDMRCVIRIPVRYVQVETLDHLLLGCVHSRETWFRVLRFYGLDHLSPQEELPYFVWWLAVRKRVHKSQRKGFDSLALLVVWSLWKERNLRVHERVALQPVSLAPRILEEARRWARADFVGIGSLGRRGLFR
jgi:hypothetical protein